MSGVVHQPTTVHECDPGWTWKPIQPDSDLALVTWEGARYGVPPTAWDYPKGTVWECECGRTWVSTGAVALNALGVCGWRRESRWAKRRRLRRAHQA